jgi:hypothetical protein
MGVDVRPLLDTLNTVYAAIDNNDDCVTISGIETGVDSILSLCIASFTNFINSLEVKDLPIPVFSVFDHQMIDSSTKLKAELIRNMSAAMLWRTTIMAIKDMGIEDFAEIGLDGGLTNLSRLIDLDLRFTTIKKINRG